MAGGEAYFRIEVMVWSRILQRYAFFVMQNYLTDVWGLSFTHAAGILNIWEGIQMILPVLLHFVVDDYLDDFNMLAISSVANTVGMIFISMSTPPILGNVTGMCKQYEAECIGYPHMALFYIGMALVAIAIAGYKVSLSYFHKVQRDGCQFLLLCHYLTTPLLVVTPRILAAALPEGNLWWVRFAVPAIFSAFAMFTLFKGKGSYKMKERRKSPVTIMLRVFTACVWNINQPLPEDVTKLYIPEDEKPFTTTTKYLRFLEKAAIDVNPQDQIKSKWKLCSVKEVEKTKVIVRMIPIWSTFIICGIVSSTGNTYFVEQLNHLSRKIGIWNVPLPIFLLYIDYVRGTGLKCMEFVYSLIEIISKRNKGPLAGIAVAMIYSVLCCITAARIERRRLNVVGTHGLFDKPDDYIPMGAYWLLFQFSLLTFGGADAIQESATVLCHRNAHDEATERYLNYFTEGVFGLSYMVGALSVHLVGRVSAIGGKPNWFQFTLNRSRLDKYYWVLAALSAANLVIFIIIACLYNRAPNADRKRKIEAQERGRDSTNVNATVENGPTPDEELCEKKKSSAATNGEIDSNISVLDFTDDLDVQSPQLNGTASRVEHKPN